MNPNSPNISSTDSPIPQTPQPPPPPIQQPLNEIKDSKNNHLAAISAAVFIVLAIGLVVYLYYQNQQLRNMLVKYSSPSPTPVPTVSDPFANWKSYTSSIDAYQLKVPQEWKEIEHPPKNTNQVIFQSVDGLYRLTGDSQKNFNKNTGKPFASLDEFIGLPYTVKATTIDGQDARQPLPRSGYENFNKVYFFSRDMKDIISLELLVGDGTLTDHRVTGDSLAIGADIFSKIISTFKFANPPVTPVPEVFKTPESSSAATLTP